MNPIVNVHFSLLIRIDNRMREFNFRQRPEKRYDVDVSDERGIRHYFHIDGDPASFSLRGNALPEWISINEKTIFSALENYLAQ